MDRGSILREAQRRAADLRGWYFGALLHFEARDVAAVAGAMANFVRIWSDEGAEWRPIAHLAWEEVQHELTSVSLKGDLLQQGRTRAANLLGEAEPPWELWEVPLVVGLLLVKTAESGFESESSESLVQSGLLLGDAIAAQHAWIANRGLAKCRKPDERTVQLDQAIDHSLMRLGRQDLGRRNAQKRAAPYAAAREWISSEWAEHRHAYKGNKSAFARHYSRRLMLEKSIDVKEKTIRDVWLRDTPSAGKTVVEPAAGE